MFNILEFFIGIICTIILIHSIFRYGLNVNVFWVAFYTFFVFFIMPNMILVLSEPLEIYSYGYTFIEDDLLVDIIYNIFICITFCTLYQLAKKNYKLTKRTRILTKQEYAKLLNIKLPPMVNVLIVLVSLLPLIVVILAPEPKLYFKYFAAFQMVGLAISEEALKWHVNIISNVLQVSVIAVILLWIQVPNDKSFINQCIKKIYLIIISCCILFFSSKRTLGILLFLILLMIEVLRNKKTPWIKIVLVVSACLGYFCVYQIIVGKTVGGGSSNIFTMYIIYFSRILDFKLATFALIYPEKIQILDYPLQSFIFDVTFYIPRSIWIGKPYPYGVYYTAAWQNTTPLLNSFRYTVSWFGEALSNLNFWGIPIGIFFYVEGLKLIGKFRNPIVQLYGMLTAVYFMVTHVQSNFVNIIILFVLYVFFEKKKKFTIKI